MTKHFILYLILLVCLLPAAGYMSASNHIGRLQERVQQLETIVDRLQNGVTIIKTPNVNNGGMMEFMTLGILTFADGTVVPWVVDAEGYETKLNELRIQYALSMEDES